MIQSINLSEKIDFFIILIESNLMLYWSSLRRISKIHINVFNLHKFTAFEQPDIITRGLKLNQ